MAKVHDPTIGELLHRVIKTHPLFTANPVGDWQELVGESVARNSQPKSLKNKVLLVMTADPVWKHHLDMLKDAILEKINSKRPESIVEKIVIRVGEVPGALPNLNPNSRLLKKLEARPGRQKKKKKTPSRLLTPEEKSFLKEITDLELRAIATRLLKHTPLDE